MKHIDEETLELYVLESEEIDARRAEIEAHLRECAGCDALRKEIEEFYSEVQSIREERSKVTSQALTLRNVALKVPTYAEFGPLSQIPKTWPARAVLFVIRHPIVSTAGFVAFFIAALLLGMQIKTAKDSNLAYARAKDEFLIAYNKSGDELWRKHVGTGYDLENLRTLEYTLEPDDYLATIDVDGDGKQEVIAQFGMRSEWPLYRAVVCYNADGSQRWRCEFHRTMTFGSESFSDAYAPRFLMVGDFDRDGRVEIVVVAQHSLYYPTLIACLDASTGELKDEYWHSGYLIPPAHRDLNGDRIDELIFAGQNNGLDLACLFVLDPRKISGHSPAPEAYTPVNVAPGTEEYYLLIPRTDLKEFSAFKRNRPATPIQLEGDNSLTIFVSEQVDADWYSVLFHFNSSLQCISVVGQDRFVTLHRRLETQGKVARTLGPQYYEDLRRAVLYWDGEKFVHEPTMNKNYVSLAQK